MASDLPSLGGVTVQPASYIPFESCSIDVKIKRCVVTLQYRKEGRGRRRFLVDGKECEPVSDGLSAEKIILPETVKDRAKLLISVVD